MVARQLSLQIASSLHTCLNASPRSNDAAALQSPLLSLKDLWASTLLMACSCTLVPKAMMAHGQDSCPCRHWGALHICPRAPGCP